MNDFDKVSPFHATETTASERVAMAGAYRDGKRTGKELINAPIFSVSQGEEIGRVHDVIFNPEQGHLVGVTIKVKGGLFRGGKTLLLRSENIHSIGDDAITVQSEELPQEIDQKVSDYAEEAGESVLGKRLMTDEGDFLGKIDDVLVDRHSRRIVAYEVSGGLWSDLMRGQTDVPVEHILSVGPDVVVVPASVKVRIQEVSGGLIGTAQVASEKIVGAKDVVVEKTNGAVAEIRTAAAEKEADYAIGKAAGADLQANDGSLIVREGEIITEHHVQRAAAEDKLHALAAVAGKSQAANFFDAAKEKLASGVETIKEKTAAGLETVKEKTHEAQDAFKDKQGEMLVGKVSGRDVVTDEGMVIVRAGTVVSDLDVANARANGLLGDLTTAVGMQSLMNAKETAVEKLDDAKASLDRPSKSESTVIYTDKVVIEPTPSLEAPRPRDPDLAENREIRKDTNLF